MKKLILFLASWLFAFEVEFNNNYQTTIFPNQQAILITSNKLNINYSPKIYTKKGIVLLNYDDADDFVRNSLYLPNGVNTKDIKIATFDVDKIRYKILQNLSTKYQKCEIKKVIFLNNNFKKVYFKSAFIDLKYKVILDCK